MQIQQMVVQNIQGDSGAMENEAYQACPLHPERIRHYYCIVCKAIECRECCALKHAQSPC